jgi:hypothetical protein
LQSPLDLSDYHLGGDRVVSAARHDHVRVTLARLHELAVHRLNRREVLLDDLVERSPANASVPLDATDEPDVRIRVNEHFHVA